MAEEKTAAPESSSTSVSASGGTSKVVLILTAVNTVAMIAVVAITLMNFKKQKGAELVTDINPDAPLEAVDPKNHDEAKKVQAQSSKTVAGELGKMISMDQFTINLSTPGSTTPKYVRVNIAVEVSNEEAEAEFNRRLPQVRNSIIDLFNSKRPSDLISPEGREALKSEIQNALNGFMVSGKIKGVFFTNFALSG